MNDNSSSELDGSQQLSLRERKKRLAQTTIEETALRLFQQKGYEKTSIQDIADEVMMSSRTFFRYFLSKEDVLLGPLHAIQQEGLLYLQHETSTESPYAALRATFMYLAHLYQQQRASFLIRYHIVIHVPLVASLYLHALIEKEPPLAEALYERMNGNINRQEVRFLVAIYMTALRVTLEEWLEQDAQGDLVALLATYLDSFSLLEQQRSLKRAAESDDQ